MMATGTEPRSAGWRLGCFCRQLVPRLDGRGLLRLARGALVVVRLRLLRVRDVRLLARGHSAAPQRGEAVPVRHARHAGAARARRRRLLVFVTTVFTSRTGASSTPAGAAAAACSRGRAGRGTGPAWAAGGRFWRGPPRAGTPFERPSPRAQRAR